MDTATSISSRVQLNDGTSMPLFGLGTYGALSGEGGQAEKAVLCALQAGYRLIETATLYRNEADVGRAIQLSGIPREQICITSKIWGDLKGREKCVKAFHDTLQKLDTNYIDVFMIHSPVGGKNAETYAAMQQLKQQGLIKSVGVANFGIQHLEGLEQSGQPLPSVNEIEVHPWHRKEAIVNYCREKGITVVAGGSLAKGKRLDDPTMGKIAAKYNKSVPQLMLRWGVQHGYVLTPRSTNPAHIKENTSIFDWDISNEDMNALNTSPPWSPGIDPTFSPWQG